MCLIGKNTYLVNIRLHMRIVFFCVLFMSIITSVTWFLPKYFNDLNEYVFHECVAANFVK